MNFAIQPAATISVTGRDASAFLQRMSTGDLRPLAGGKDPVSTLFLTSQGKLVDWVWAVPGDDGILLVSQCLEHAKRLREWLSGFVVMEELELGKVVNDWALITGFGVPIERCASLPGRWWTAIPTTIGWALGLLADPEIDAAKTALQANGIPQVSLKDAEQTRITGGVPSPSKEYGEEINPLILRLGNVAISFKKGCFVGQEVVNRMDSQDKLSRLLMGFEGDSPSERLDGHPDDLQITVDGKRVGRVSSMTVGKDGAVVGLAIVGRDHAVPKPAALHSSASGFRDLSVRLVDRPFWGK